MWSVESFISLMFSHLPRILIRRSRWVREKTKMGNLWFKFYGAEYLSDPKMDRLTVQERSCWLTLLCMASQSDGIVKYLSAEGLLTKSGIKFDPYDSTEWDRALNVLKTFEQYEMIIVRDTGEIEVKNWKKRQEHNLTAAERMSKMRLKKKSVTRGVTDDVTKVTAYYNRIEENRIDKNREEEPLTPLKEAKLFFSGDDSILKEFCSKLKVPPEILKNEVTKFVGYWTELNKSGTKQRWEQEPTFEVRRRLARWLSSANNFNNAQKETKIII